MHSVHTDDSTIVGAPIIAPDEGCRQVTHGSFFSSSLQFTHWLVITNQHLVKVPLKRVTPTISKTIPQSLITLTPFEFWKALEASLKLRSTHLITGVPIIMKRE